MQLLHEFHFILFHAHFTRVSQRIQLNVYVYYVYVNVYVHVYVYVQVYIYICDSACKNLYNGFSVSSHWVSSSVAIGSYQSRFWVSSDRDCSYKSVSYLSEKKPTTVWVGLSRNCVALEKRTEFQNTIAMIGFSFWVPAEETVTYHHSVSAESMNGDFIFTIIKITSINSIGINNLIIRV